MEEYNTHLEVSREPYHLARIDSERSLADTGTLASLVFPIAIALGVITGQVIRMYKSRRR